MKKYLAMLVAMLLMNTHLPAQDRNAAINHYWINYAEDTALTYGQIVHICDSLFAHSGFSDTLQWKTDTADENGIEEGGGYVKYLRWRSFWQHRYDVATGKLHNIAADIADELANNNKTTSATNCAGTSALQSSITSDPLGWRFIGPQNVATCTGGQCNALKQSLGQVNDVVLNPANHNEIYIMDQWGGIWKTSDANAAPNNTWVCLTDHLPAIAGIGITQFWVEFVPGGLNRIYCVVGSPYQNSLPNINSSNPRTIGIFYSTDDGATFHQMDLSGFIPDPGAKPILCMSYWPGNSTSGAKYMFVTTPFQIYRLNITDPAAIEYRCIYDIESTIPANGRNDRFRGFSALTFDKDDPDIMYVATRSNAGYGMGHTAAIYQTTHCSSCSTCPLLYVPGVTGNVVGNGGFTLSPFPDNTQYPNWKNNGWERDATSGDPLLKCVPTTTVKSVEVEVYGSYLHNVDYNISFVLTLPPNTEVDVVLKDVHINNAYTTDWGTSTAGPATFSGMQGLYYVGHVSGGSDGHYKNLTGSVVTHTVVATVSATDYVCRLEFGCYALTGYSTSDGVVKLDNVEVIQEYDDRFRTFRCSPTAGSLLYCTAEKGAIPMLRKIEDGGGGTFTVNEYRTLLSYVDPDIVKPELFTFSSVDPNIVYFFRPQCLGYKKIVRFNLSDPTNPSSYTDDAYTAGQIHADIRCMYVHPNATGTDDVLYAGTDGGLAKGSLLGTWTSLNGRGLRTSWANDVGSDIYTGEVGFSASDNGVFWDVNANHTEWANLVNGDGGQLKYGRSAISKSTRFAGFTGGGTGFNKLYWEKKGGLPIFEPSGIISGIHIMGLGKMANTFSGDFFGTTTDKHVYRFGIQSGLGTIASKYYYRFDPITTSVSARQSVQAIAADMYDGNYMAVYQHNEPWERGQFIYSTNVSSVTPSWSIVDNTTSIGLGWSLTTLVVDPAYHSSGKRLWAGASGYGTAGDNRMFETTNGGDLWDDISTGLPNGPINALAYDEFSGYLFAGTDQGIYAFNANLGTHGSGNPWVCYSLNLPNAFVTGLDVNNCTGKLYASTYGRGAYEAELPPPNSEVLTGTTLWNSERRIYKPINVPSGTTLTIENCTVYFGKEAYIRVQQGGKLVVNNATLTSECGAMWGGIQVWGDNYHEQSATYQGMAIIGTGSVIEHARTGITNYNPSPSVVNSAGGIIKANNCTFRNNVVSADFKPFTSYGSIAAMPDASSFNQVAFLWDDAYRGKTFGYVPKKLVSLEEVQGIKFMGCSFNNNITAVPYRGVGDGINAANAGFVCMAICPSVTAPCTTSGTPTRFRGLTNGVYVRRAGIYLDQTVSLDRCTFDDISVGVNVLAHAATSVRRCVFNVGRGYISAPGYAPGVTVSCSKNVGILTQNAHFTRVEDNVFIGVSNTYGYTPWYNIGVWMDNSSNFTKRIMKNQFNALSYGVVGSGDNCSDAYPASSGIGMQVSCNEFSGNNYDILSAGIFPTQGIEYIQSGPAGGDAGNVFSGSTRNVVNSNSTRPLNYYYYGTPPSTLGVVTVSDVLPASTCFARTLPPRESPHEFMPGPITGLDETELQDQKALYYEAVTASQHGIDSIGVATDAGNTTTTMEWIDSCSDRNVLYDSLGKVSPWLSDSALATVVVNAQQGEYSSVLNLLAANPDVIKDDIFLNIVANYMAMDTNDIAMLRDTAATQTPRTALTNRTAAAVAAMNEHNGIILMSLKSATDTAISQHDTTLAGICLDTTSRYYLLDSNAHYSSPDTLDVWLSNVHAPWAEYERVGLRIFRHDWQGATDVYNSIDTGKMTVEEKEEHYAYGVLLQTQVTAGSQFGRNVLSLNQNELATLDALVTDNSGAHSIFGGVGALSSSTLRVRVWNIPNILTPVPCPETHEEGKPANNKREIWKYAIDKVQQRVRGYIKAYPNPSDGIVTFDYQIPPAIHGDALLVITNVLGEKVMTKTISTNSGRVVWNSGQLAGGTYMYQLTNNTGLVGMGKVVLVK